MTEQQQRAASAELARRMGWREGEFAAIWFPPDGNLKRVQADPPGYFTDPAASWELRLWLAADDARWAKLKQQLTALWGSAAEQDLIRFALTLPCKTIAEAACKALGIEVSE